MELEEFVKELTWKEKIVVKIFKDIFNKIYKIGITYGFNNK